MSFHSISLRSLITPSDEQGGESAERLPSNTKRLAVAPDTYVFDSKTTR